MAEPDSFLANVRIVILSEAKNLSFSEILRSLSLILSRDPSVAPLSQDDKT